MELRGKDLTKIVQVGVGGAIMTKTKLITGENTETTENDMTTKATTN